MSRLDIITGPSGTGKSHFAAQQPDWTRVWNLDALEREAGDRAHALELMNAGIAGDLKSGRDCVIDHIFDTEAMEHWLVPAREAGYDVIAWLLANDSAGTQIRRVRNRRRKGGHGAGDDDVLRLHYQGIGAFPELVLLAHETLLYDTSTTTLRPIAHIRGFECTRMAGPEPDWTKELTLGLTPMPTQPRLLEALTRSTRSARNAAEREPGREP